jgi:peptidoglycan-associated lipoprotein
MSKKRIWSVLTLSLCMVLVATAMSGCKSKKQEIDPGFTDTGTTGSTTYTDTGTGDGLPDVDLSRLLFDSGSQYGLQTVYFDFDSSSLRPDAMQTLRDNAEKIRQVPNVMIQLAGHCDERGTQEYNLALGERRALSVREYLIQLGVPANRIVTISYGKEFPAVEGSNEAAYSMNRRVEFNRAQY